MDDDEEDEEEYYDDEEQLNDHGEQDAEPKAHPGEG